MLARLATAICFLALALLLSTANAGAQAQPEFKLGFKALATLIPGVAGTPVEDEHYGANGDSLQQTSTGLMVWRKSDNWTAFTDGSITWINGPLGLQSRLNSDRFDWEKSATPSPPSVQPGATSAGYPRVNVYPTAESERPDWSMAPIFWFGRATEQENYVDVRVGYNDEALYLHATVVDYHLWYDRSGGGDPREFDSLGLLLGTGSGPSSSLRSTDYLLVSGFRGWPLDDDPRWHWDARGDSGSWDPSWSPSSGWTDQIGLRYYNSGPNNDSDRDAGWATSFRIPWETFGLSGPPPAGTNWRLGTILYDRDGPAPGDMVREEQWPASLVDSNSTTWGTLAFGGQPLAKPDAQAAGTTVVRRGLSGAKVMDAYVGGGGNCQGGIFGDGDKPHSGGENLFVQNQSDVADFPCFSKSYLWFDLADVPAGKVILSAALRIYGFGGSDPTQARPSYVQLFIVAGGWDEANLTWNNAPDAQENISGTRVDVIHEFPGWPGVANEWDATRAVAQAYAEGRPVNLALYSADTAYHSGKYFVSSDTGDWNASGRPSLTITWGDR